MTKQEAIDRLKEFLDSEREVFHHPTDEGAKVEAGGAILAFTTALHIVKNIFEL